MWLFNMFVLIVVINRLREVNAVSATKGVFCFSDLIEVYYAVLRFCFCFNS